MSMIDGLPNRRTTVLLLLSALFISCMAQSHDILTPRVQSIVFAMDARAARHKPIQSVTYIADTLQARRSTPPDDRQSVIVFGSDASVELSPLKDFQLPSSPPEVDQNAANIEQALSLSSKLVREDEQGRIVLISDGIQSDGDVSRILPQLKSRHISVDVLPIEYAYQHEVCIERLDLPQQVTPGNSYEATVVLSSLSPGEGRLTLSESGVLVAEQRVEYVAGQNRYSFPIAPQSAGEHAYVATIDVPRDLDNIAENNSLRNSIFVNRSKSVLLVVDYHESGDGWKALRSAIERSGREVQVVHGSKLSDNAAVLQCYGAIVFYNVARSQFQNSQLVAVHDAVRDFGTGFLMVGGENSFGPGGYHGTVMEDLLPVSTQFKPGKRAVVFVLDQCHFPAGSVWSKRVTKVGIKLLTERDEAGVLAHNGGENKWLFKLAPASKFEELAPVINNVQLGDIPAFQDVMQMALEELSNSNAMIRHVIVITGGKPLSIRPETIRAFEEAQITISAVITHPGRDFDPLQMNDIVGATGGRSYIMENDPNLLPSMITEDLQLLPQDRCHLRGAKVVPVSDGSSRVLKGLEEFPRLNGYTLTTAKNAAGSQILGVPRNGSDLRDPLLAVWTYGLGKAAAFTSSFNSDWSKEWQKWDQFPTFVEQLITDITAEDDERFPIMTLTSARDLVIVVDRPEHEESAVAPHVQLRGPHQKSSAIDLQKDGSGRFRGSVPAWGEGSYLVQVRHHANGAEMQTSKSLYIPAWYSPEVLQFRANRQMLEEIANRSGGRVLTGDPVRDAIFTQQRSFVRSSQISFDGFLILLGLMPPIGFVIRRIPAVVVGIWEKLFPPAIEPPQTTLHALLRTKQWVSAALSSEGKSRLLIQIWSPPPRRYSKKRPVPEARGAMPSTNTSIDANADTENGDLSTLQKLVSWKRQQDEQA